MNESTIKALQGILGVTQDGIWGKKSQAALDAIIHPHTPQDSTNHYVEYNQLFEKCVTRPEKTDEVRNFINRLMQGIAKYEEVEKETGVPWYVIGLIHGMECDFSFSEHLHNGDPLSKRTVNVPAGRPNTGNPPFTWKESAIDALQYDKFTGWSDWSAAGICFKLEGYNGWGYRNHGINSPYLWSFSNNYTRGKYTSDGHWDPDAVSKQVGAITALKQMVSDHLVILK